MSDKPLASGAQAILDARNAGQMPGDHVIVSLVGAIPYSNPVVYYRPGCDWRCLAELNVMLWCKSPENIAGALMEIAWYPKNLILWADDAQQGWRIWPEFHCRDFQRFSAELDSLSGQHNAVHRHAQQWFPEWAHQERWRMGLKSMRYTKQDIFGAPHPRHN